jgi:hypothetical protein
MQAILDLINDLLIYDAFDELDDLGTIGAEYEQLKAEYENGAGADFVVRFKRFVEGLGKEEEQEKKVVKNTIVNEGNNNTFIQGVSDSTIGLGKSAKAKKKLLFIAANPKNTTALQLPVEYRNIQQSIRQGSERESIEWLSPIFAATLEEVMHGLAQKPEIVHFSGHGVDKGIYLEQENGMADLLTNDQLQLLFNDLKGTVKIILLNSCYSAAQAQFLSSLGCSVVGYNLPIGDAAALGFAKGFYIGLSHGKSFQASIEYGMVYLMKEQGRSRLSLEAWVNGDRVPL